MVRMGRYSFIIGLLVTVAGLVLGFGFMFAGNHEDLAELFLMSVPLGFLFLFAGLSTIVLFSPRDSEK